MKRPYTQLWLLLTSAFVIFACLSTFETFHVFGWEFKGSDIYASVVKDIEAEGQNIENEISKLPLSAQKDNTPEKFERAPMDTTPKSILFIGDSMLEGLSPRMAAYAKANGHKLNSVIWYSSTSETWGSCDTLKYFIRKFHPDFVMVSLGANELFVRNITTKRKKYVANILSQIGTIPHIWIGPPNWKEDTGINELVAQASTPGTFFLTNGMKFDRAKDGAHPTRSSAIVWMDSVVRWNNMHGAHPIKLEIPSESLSRANSTTILQPKK